MEKIKEFWDLLPKTVKVLGYLIISTILAEGLIELKGLEQTFIVRILAQIINLVLVFLGDAVPAIRERLSK